MTPIFDAIAKSLGISSSMLTESGTFLGIVSLKKGDHWLKMGEPASKVGFVLSGLLRKYRTDAHGDEFTTDLVRAPDLLAPYADVLQNRSSSLSFQALEETQLAVFELAPLRKLAEHDMAWARLLLRVTEELYVGKENRESFFATHSVAERVESFLTKNPDLTEKVPKQIIASYLGINASTLSRELKKRGTTPPQGL